MYCSNPASCGDIARLVQKSGRWPGSSWCPSSVDGDSRFPSRAAGRVKMRTSQPCSCEYVVACMMFDTVTADRVYHDKARCF